MDDQLVADVDDQLTPPRGRRPRGKRHMVLIRVPEASYLQLAEESRRRGLGLSEFVCAELATKHDLEVPGYIQPVLVEVSPNVWPIAPRKNITARVPAEHHARYSGEAQARGVSLAEYVRSVLGIGEATQPRSRLEEDSLLSA